MHFGGHRNRNSKMSSKWCIEIVFIVFLVPMLIKIIDAGSCDNLFPKENGPTMVRSINQGSDLKKYLSEISSLRNYPGENKFGNALFKLNIINGTIWLSHSGDVREFSPVLGTPPATSSDMSLSTAMEKLSKASLNPPPRVLLSYHPEEIGDWSKDSIASYSKVIPTWSSNTYSSNDIYDYGPSSVNTNVNQEEGTNSSSAYSMMESFKLAHEKIYGLDVVFDRVQAEDILMLLDFNRIKHILSTFFVKSGSSLTDSAISDPDALYLRRKYRIIERNHKNTFTELFLSNLVHLLPDDKGGNGGEFAHQSRPKKAWKRPKGKIEFLPDLQKTDVVYSKKDIENLKIFLTKTMVKGKNTCTLVEVRAGIFLQNESLLNLAEVLKDGALDFQLYVRSEPYDTLLNVNALSSAMKIVGENRLVVDFPTDLHTQLEKLSTQIKTPGVRNQNINYRKNIRNGIDRSDTVLTSSASSNIRSYDAHQLYQSANLVIFLLFAILSKKFL